MKETHKRRSVIWYILGVPLGLVLLLLLVMVGREAAEKRRFEARLNQLKSKGVPTDNQSISAEYESETSQADALAWNAVFAWFQSDEFKLATADLEAAGVDFHDPRIPNVARSKELNAAESFLLKFNPLYDEIRNCARNHPNPRFISKFESLDTLLPHGGWLRTAARHTMLHGLVAIKNEDRAAVVADYKSILGCSDALRSGTTVIEHLVSVAIQHQALKVLKLAVERDLISDSDLTEILPELLVRSNIDPGFRAGIRGELGAVMPILTDQELRYRQLPSVTNGLTAYLPFRSADANCYMEYMEQALAIPIDDIDMMNESLQSLDAIRSTPRGWTKKFDTALTSELSFNVGRYGESFIKLASQYRVSAIAVAIRLYERDHGNLPTSLDELAKFGVNATQLRPLGGKPFGYDPSKSVVLWDPNQDAGNPELKTMSTQELREFLDNAGPTQWRFREEKSAEE